MKIHSFKLRLKEKTSKHQIQSATDFLPPGIFCAFTISSFVGMLDCSGTCVYVCGIGIYSVFGLIITKQKFMFILF